MKNFEVNLDGRQPMIYNNTMARYLSFTLSDEDRLKYVCYALDSPVRRKILQLCTIKSFTIKQLSELTNNSLSTTSFHIKTLKEAGLINISARPAKKGHELVVSLEAVNLIISMSMPQKLRETNRSLKAYKTEIPVGSFTSFSIQRPCGMANAEGHLLEEESIVGAFYSHQRYNAQLIWTSMGYLEYQIPCYPFASKEIESINISCEICSETSNYDNTYKSEITFWLNDIELATYLSPGDFGGRPGKLTPKNWTLSATQYGLLVQLTINEQGTFLNGKQVSDVTASQFDNCPEDDCLTLKIGNKPTAKYKGGFNLFGRCFGDYPQDIKFDLYYYTNGRDVLKVLLNEKK